jgi:hypothetical protein
MHDVPERPTKTARLAAAITTLLTEHAQEKAEGVSRIDEPMCLDALVSVAATLLADPPDDRHERSQDFYSKLHRAIEKAAAAAGAADVREPLAVLSRAERDELQQQMERYKFVVADAKRHFGLWDTCDPVVWALIAVVQAQNDLAHAIEQDVSGGAERMVEDAISERIKAINALVKAIKDEPRGFQ